MEPTTFFPGASRRVILGSPTKQVTSNRIMVPVRMPLTGESVTGMPSWLGEAYTAATNFAREMCPEIENVSDIALAFANDGSSKTTGELFDNPNAKAPNSEMKNFAVLRVGDPDGDPEVELHFKVYMPFARDLWRWVGEMGGKEVFMAFPSTLGKAVSIVKPDNQASLPMDDAPNEAEKEALAGDSKPEDDPGSPAFEDQVRKSMGAPKTNPQRTRLESVKPPRGGKSGPKELAAYHAGQGDKAAKPGRRSPAVN